MCRGLVAESGIGNGACYGHLFLLVGIEATAANQGIGKALDVFPLLHVFRKTEHAELCHNLVVGARRLGCKFLVNLHGFLILALLAQNGALDRERVFGKRSVFVANERGVDVGQSLVEVALAIVVAAYVVFCLGCVGAVGVICEILLHLGDAWLVGNGELLGCFKCQTVNLGNIEAWSVGHALQEVGELLELSALGINEFHVFGSGLSLVA